MAESSTLYGFKFREPDQRRVEGNRVVDIKQLWQRSHEILNLALLGHKQEQIAKMLCLHPSTVSNTLNSTLGKEALAERREARDQEYEELYEEVMDLTKKSLEVYKDILDRESADPEVSLKMKKETADTVVLELSGLRAPTKIDSRHVGVHLTSEEIEQFKQRGLAAAKASGKLIDIEP